MRAGSSNELRAKLPVSRGWMGVSRMIVCVTLMSSRWPALTEVVMDAAGYYAQPFLLQTLREGWNEPPVGPLTAAAVAPTYFDWRAATIYGGSSEIQKNIIAKHTLGL